MRDLQSQIRDYFDEVGEPVSIEDVFFADADNERVRPLDQVRLAHVGFRRPWLIGAVAFVAVLLIGAVTVFVAGDPAPSTQPPATETPASTLTSTTHADTTTQQPTTTAGDASSEEANPPPTPEEITEFGIDQTHRVGLSPIAPGVEVVYWVGQTHGDDASRLRLHVVKVDPASGETEVGVVGDRVGNASRGGPEPVSAAAGDRYLWLGWSTVDGGGRVVAVDYETLAIEMAHSLAADSPIFGVEVEAEGGVVWVAHSASSLYRIDEANPEQLLPVEINDGIGDLAVLADGAVMVAEPLRVEVFNRKGDSVWSAVGEAEWAASANQVYQLKPNGELFVYQAQSGRLIRELPTELSYETSFLDCCFDGLLAGGILTNVDGQEAWRRFLLNPDTGESSSPPWNDRSHARADSPIRLWLEPDQDWRWRLAYDPADINGWPIDTPGDHYDHSDAVVVVR